MKVYKRLVIDMDTGKRIEEDSFDYQGPVAWCDFGGGGGKASADAQNQAALAIAQLNEQMYKQTRSDLGPFREVGTATTPYYAGILGIPGYESVDPTAALRSTPGYNWLMDQGTDALSRAAAAKGMLGSGAVAKGLTTFGQGLADQSYNNYMNRLYNLIGTGQNAAAQTGSFGMQSAANTGNALMSAAQAQDQASYINSQNKGNNWLNSLTGGLGLLGSVALAPVTGGSSLAGGAGILGNTLAGRLWNGGAGPWG